MGTSVSHLSTVRHLTHTHSHACTHSHAHVCTHILTHAHKSVAKQIAADNHICVVAHNPEQNQWLRIFCQAIDDSNNIDAKQAIIDEFDWAEAAGYTLDNPDFKCYYLANAKAELRDCEGDLIAEYTF